MGVVSSTYVVDNHAQIDGRRYVVETHTLNVGNPVVIEYLAAVDADYGSILSARVAQIDASLAETEADQIIAGD